MQCVLKQSSAGYSPRSLFVPVFLFLQMQCIGGQARMSVPLSLSKQRMISDDAIHSLETDLRDGSVEWKRGSSDPLV